MEIIIFITAVLFLIAPRDPAWDRQQLPGLHTQVRGKQGLAARHAHAHDLPREVLYRPGDRQRR
jgi:hypothetical protein